ncbi:MAG: 23S rRNA (adenine(2503)-C(2))-methyltransferase RlmN, partial [Oligoflexales bacterium]|nr:23S rRNA (adenine(2503)-C(2))-methyltransferase RlmN [Oligoflexales bacterium]
MKHFLSLSLMDFKSLISGWGQPEYRAAQIYDWIYKKGALSPSGMSNLPGSLRERLKSDLDFNLPSVEKEISSAEDNSTKILFKNAAGDFFESVIIRHKDRTTLCVSTQIGCRLGCRFCLTGNMGFKGNLGVHEILSQVVLAG